MEFGEGRRNNSRAGKIQKNIKYALLILLSLHLVNILITVTKRFKIHGNKQSKITKREIILKEQKEYH